MARSRRGPIGWYSPDPRGVLPLDAFHCPKSLRRRVRSGRFHLTRDRAFAKVISRCAQPRKCEAQTWISDEIIEAYTGLHEAGLAHSVEAWVRDRAAEPQNQEPGNVAAAGDPGELVGGLYGVAIGSAFFGESMFSRATDASKVCLVHLVEHLRDRGFTLLDVQFTNPHLVRFGVVQIPRDDYIRQLQEAIARPVTW